MRYCFLFICSMALGNYLVTGKISDRKVWTKTYEEEKLNVRFLLQYLQRSKIGAQLVLAAKLKAKKQGFSFEDLILAGENSLTDTTLVRKFSPSKPSQVNYSTESRVYINRELSQFDALLDLAHELTHYVYRDGFNPYADSFTLDGFIESTIEREGGEAHAFIMECKILDQLFPGKLSYRKNCDKIRDENSSLSFKKTVRSFYAVGEHYSDLSTRLKKDAMRSREKITENKALFISSAYGLPYPVAAYKEYSQVMEKVCENDLKRYLSMAKKGRSIASMSDIRESILSRCEKI